MLGSLEWRRDNAALADMFDWLRNREVVYFINPGNAGDGLIAQSTYDLLDQHGIRWRAATHENLSDQIVVIAGGGNFIGLYDSCRDVAAIAFEHAKLTIILPHTIRDQAAVLSKAGPNAHIFCREVPSYEHVQMHVRGARVHLAHDLALFYDPGRLLNDQELRLIAEPRMQEIVERHQLAFPHGVAGAAVTCFRGDREKTQELGDERNIDISQVFKTGVKPGMTRVGTYMFLRFIAMAGRMDTNRLHVGIGAALTGTAAALHDNSYGKNGAVYDHSLAGRYGGISFSGPRLGGDGDAASIARDQSGYPR